MDPERRAERDERLALYEIAVLEYRFQVQLNWDRAKYLMGFNVAIIGLGTGLVQVAGTVTRLLLGIFVVGAASAVLSVFAVRVQHAYYQASRDNTTDQAMALHLGLRGVTTTPGARRDRTRWWQHLGKVQTILYVLLGICAVVDVFGIVYVATRP